MTDHEPVFSATLQLRPKPRSATYENLLRSLAGRFKRVVNDIKRGPRLMLPQHFRGRAVLCLSLISILVGCGGDRRQYFYNTLADADRAGEITRGWIPNDLMPASSRSIHLVEELSPSREWCSFEFLPTDIQNLRKNLKSVDGLPRAVTRVPNPGAVWWPRMLQGSIHTAEIHHAGFDLYVLERPANGVDMGVYLFAINWSEGRGFFYWTYDPYHQVPE